MTWIRLLETVHGHLGVLAAAALLHPAILMRRGLPLSRGGWWSVALTTTVTCLAFGTGLAIYGDYREVVKPELFREAPEVGLLFETKEHLAWMVLSIALGAGVASLMAPRRAGGVRRAAAALYAVAALLCLAAAALGSWVASVRGFPF